MWLSSVVLIILHCLSDAWGAKNISRLAQSVSRSTFRSDDVELLHKRVARVRANKIVYHYHCPVSKAATETFELAVYYWPGTDYIDWTKLKNVEDFKYRYRSGVRPIRAGAVFYQDVCPEHQRLDAICTYHFEGHLETEIYTHFVTLDVIRPANPASIRAPVVIESCVDMSRAPHNKLCPEVKSWTTCTVTFIALLPLDQGVSTAQNQPTES